MIYAPLTIVELRSVSVPQACAPDGSCLLCCGGACCSSFKLSNPGDGSPEVVIFFIFRF